MPEMGTGGLPPSWTLNWPPIIKILNGLRWWGGPHKNFKLEWQNYKICKKIHQNFVNRKKWSKNVLPPIIPPRKNFQNYPPPSNRTLAHLCKTLKFIWVNTPQWGTKTCTSHCMSVRQKCSPFYLTLHILKVVSTLAKSQLPNFAAGKKCLMSSRIWPYSKPILTDRLAHLAYYSCLLYGVLLRLHRILRHILQRLCQREHSQW